MTLLPREDQPYDLAPVGYQPDDLFEFSGSVGRDGANDRADVIRAQILLGNAGFYDLPNPGVPTGWPGGSLDRSIRAYQKNKGLIADGLLLPLGPEGVGRDGSGETLAALKNDLRDALHGYAVPAPEDVDDFYRQRPDAADGQRLRSAIVLASQTGEPTGMVRLGQQVAQAVPLMPSPVAPPASDAPLPHERPDVKAAGAALEKAFNTATDRIGGAAADVDDALKLLGPINLLTLPPHLLNSLIHSEPAGTPPSEPPDDRDRDSGRTPPLEPPNVDTELKGRPAEAQTSPSEKLIPPEVEDSIRLLPSLQRPLAEIAAGIILDQNIHGGRGKPETVEGNRIAAKVCVDTLGEFPKLAGMEHTHGGIHKERGELKEEVIKRKDNSPDLRGSSRPDVSFYGKNEKHAAYLNTDTIRKTGSDSIETETQTPDQARRFEKLQNNIKQGVAVWARKMKPGETEASYSSYVRLRCRQMWSALQDKLAKDGDL